MPVQCPTRSDTEVPHNPESPTPGWAGPGFSGPGTRGFRPGLGARPCTTLLMLI
ncbi:hypothetical protein BD309DRAFT_214549 [Dichomitus squalens]|nr:hypothetical protein BD309DRAFT_214549 [Dichomitus squalens]